MRYILTLDGGGIKGIIPATILKYIEEKAKIPINLLFDLVAGTSTGGILGAGLVTPNKNGEPAHSANELLDFYVNAGNKIFSSSLWKKLSSINGFFNERYSHEELEKTLESLFGNVKIEETLTNLLVISYDLESRKTYLFKSYEKHNVSCFLKDVARATSAAPSFFEPHIITEKDSRKVLIDGSLIANNPAMFSYVEAKKIFRTERIKILSIGTGIHEDNLKPLSFEKVKNWGMLRWTIPGINIMMEESSSSVDLQLESLLGNRYKRLQPILSTTDASIDDITEENIKSLQSEAEYFIENNYKEIDIIIKDLVRNYKIKKVKKFFGLNY